MPKWKYAYIIQLNLRKIRRLPWCLCKGKEKRLLLNFLFSSTPPPHLLLLLPHCYIHLLMERFQNTTLKSRSSQAWNDQFPAPSKLTLGQSSAPRLFDITCGNGCMASLHIYAHTPKAAPPQSIVLDASLLIVSLFLSTAVFIHRSPHNER